jgi:signal transduction histidine kinase
LVGQVTGRKKPEALLRQSEENLRYLASQILNAQERERKRIARELHDNLGQSLLLLKLQLSTINRENHRDTLLNNK